MKIGIDARLYRSSAAGIGRYSQNLIKNLLEIDRENDYVLFMTSEDAAECNLKYSNLKIIQTDIPHYSLVEQTKLPGIIEREKCDLVHFLNFNHPVKYQGKFIVTIHDLTLLFYPETAKRTNFIKHWGFKYVFKSACQKAVKIIAVSESTKKDIIKNFNVEPSKIKVIYEAADDTRTSREILRLKAQDDKPIILYVGQYREHKNVKGLLEAYKLLKKEINCQLVLVGNVPESYNYLIDRDADLRDTLRPGFVSDEELAAWYKLAKIFVFPSLHEGFGLPGLEAMAAGLPVVASNTSSLPEIYGEAALYFDPSNPKEIADKIRLVISDKQISGQLIKQGKIQAKKYSWKKTAEETLKIYSLIRNTK